MSKKLLLADDSVTIQKVIEITFANEDYDLTIVGNGNDAYEKAKLISPDLILADIIMPGKNGYELCEEVKKTSGLSHTPVLLLAGSFEPFDEDKARASGAESWIAKPFESQALVEKVKELLAASTPPVQKSAAPAVPSLEEKEASLENIIPLDVSGGSEPPGAATPEEPAEVDFEFETEVLDTEDSSLTDMEGFSETLEEETLDVGFSPDVETTFAAEETETPAPATFDHAGSDPSALDLEGDEDEEILLLDESDILIEDEAESEAPVMEEAFAPADEPIEEAVPEKDEAVDGSSEPAFDFEFASEEPVVEEEPAVAQAEEETVSFGDISTMELPGFDDTSSFSVEEETPEPPRAPEPVEEPAMEFSFEELEEGFSEDQEIALEPEAESVAQAPVTVTPPLVVEEKVAVAPAAEDEKATPTYAQMEQKVHSLTDAQLQAIVEKVAGATIERIAREVLEQVAWEVVPNLSENIIKEEIQKIKAAQ